MNQYNVIIEAPGARYLAQAVAAAKLTTLTPESFGAQSGILLDPEARTVVNDVLAAGPCTVQYARLLDLTVRRFIRARQNINPAATATSDPLWDDVTYSVGAGGIVTFSATGLADREQKAFNWINEQYIRALDGVNDTGHLPAITATELNAAEAIDATANTTALRAWLAAIGNYQAIGKMSGAVYPINDSLRLASGTTIEGVEGYTTIKMVAGQSEDKNVVWTGDIDEPREDIHLRGIIFDQNNFYSTTASHSLPASSSLRGNCLNIGYTRRFSVIGCAAFDSHKHLFDFTGSRHPRSGTAYTYPDYDQVSQDGWIDRCWGEGFGDDGFTTHNVRGLKFGKIWGGFGTQRYNTNNSNLFEIDDDSDDVTAEDVTAYFCNSTEVKGHSDAHPARNVVVNEVHMTYCNNGIVIRHGGHGGAGPESPLARNVRFGKITIRNPLRWVIAESDSRGAFRAYAYQGVSYDALYVYQGDADDDYYGTDAGQAIGMVEFLNSGRDYHMGYTYVDGFPDTIAVLRPSSSFIGPLTFDTIVTRNGPMRVVHHTGDANVTGNTVEGHRETATTGSLCVNISGDNSDIQTINATNFERRLDRNGSTRVRRDEGRLLGDADNLFTMYDDRDDSFTVTHTWGLTPPRFAPGYTNALTGEGGVAYCTATYEQRSGASKCWKVHRSGSQGNEIYYTAYTASAWAGWYKMDLTSLVGSVEVTAATYTVAASDRYIRVNRAGTVTLTLPSASAEAGRRIEITTQQAQAVISASSNVIPGTSGTAGTAILRAVAGANCVLVSNGTSWRVDAYSEPVANALTDPRMVPGVWVNVPGSSGVQVAHTGTTDLTVACTITVPGGWIGPNGRLRIRPEVTIDNTPDEKDVVITFGGTEIHNPSVGALDDLTGWATDILLVNRGAQNSQFFRAITATNSLSTTTSSAATTATVDTSVDQDLVVSLQVGNASDTIRLESIIVEVMYLP